MAISSAKIWNKSITLISICLFTLFALSACTETLNKSEDNIGSEKTVVSESSESQSTEVEDNDVKSELKMKINSETVIVEWEDNESVSALKELAAESSVTISTSLYGGFEQVGSIGQRLPSNDKHITTLSGDIVLCSGNQLVVFYGSNTWAYTKLGHIKDKTPAELTALLENGNVTITISINQ